MYASGSVRETASGRAMVPHKPQLQCTTVTQLSLSVGRKHRINWSTSSTNLNYTSNLDQTDHYYLVTALPHRLQSTSDWQTPLLKNLRTDTSHKINKSSSKHAPV